MATTIYALASGPTKSGIAVIRLSGPKADVALARLMSPLPEARLASVRALRDPLSGDLLDRGVVIRYPSPASFTGEDVVELQIHGGRAVIDAVLRSLGGIDGLRMADPGEFTRRAFLNERMDLSQVEALADLLDAETEAQRRQALRGMMTGLGAAATRWREELIQARGLAEAGIDFSDEGDVASNLIGSVRSMTGIISKQITNVLDDARRGERLRQGFQIVLAGGPNAGKSTLLNSIAKRDVAIVSDIPGTTRDTIEVHLDLDGYPVTVTDTAGIRPSDDPLEQQGIARSRARLATADLILWLTPADSLNPADGPGDVAASVWKVLSKADLVDHTDGCHDLTVSALSGSGLDDLLDKLKDMARDSLGGGEAPLITHARHRSILEEVKVILDRAMGAEDTEIIAEDLRAATQAIGRISGHVHVEDVLGAIFERFCIGK